MKDYLNLLPKPTTNAVTRYILFVLDISSSMGTDDWMPSRLRVATNAIIEMLTYLRATQRDVQVGVVVFNHESQLLQPLGKVTDQEQTIVDQLNAQRASGSTNITEAMSASLAELERATASYRVVPPSAEQAFHQWLSRASGSGASSGYGGSGSSTGDNGLLSSVGDADGLIVLATDGDHNCGSGPEPVAKTIRDKGYGIAVIGVADRAKLDEAQLKRIASTDASGESRYRFVGDAAQLLPRMVEMLIPASST